MTFQPLEERLSIGATTYLKTLRGTIRRSIRVLMWSTQQWGNWLAGALLFLLLACLAPVVDWALVRTWRERGFTAFRVSTVLGIAVYVRLLIDARAPVVGKALLAFAIVYGVASADLVPDGFRPFGLLDDVVLIVLAARSFMRLCPDRLVEEHAVKAARARERNLTRRLSGRHVPGSGGAEVDT